MRFTAPTEGYYRDMRQDRGDINISKLLLIVALVLFILLGLAGAGWIIEGHKALEWALLGWGLAFYVGASLAP